MDWLQKHNRPNPFPKILGGQMWCVSEFFFFFFSFQRGTYLYFGNTAPLPKLGQQYKTKNISIYTEKNKVE